MLTRYAQGSLIWIDLTSPTPAEVRGLMHEFGLDPLVAEELLIPSYKSKIERRGESVYVILHFPTPHAAHQRQEQEIDFIIGREFLITAHYEGIDPLHVFAKAFEVDAVLSRHAGHTHGGHVFAEMLHSIYRALGDECDLLRRRLQKIEESIFTGDERKMVLELSHEGRIIHDFRQALVPHREMLKSLEPHTGRLFGAEFSFHLRAVEGALERVENTLENLRGSLSELRETNNSLLTTKQNDIMKRLTMMAFVTFPLTLISSVFGMNTIHNPIVGSPGDFWMVLGLMSALALSFFVYFRHRSWL